MIFRKSILTSFSLLICFISFGCSSKEKLEAVLDSYVGYPISSLKKQMGEPKNIQKINGSQAYIYGFLRTVYVPPTTVASTNTTGGAYTNFLGDSAYTSLDTNSTTTVNTYGGYYQNYYCILKFFTNGSKVSSATYEGNSCLTYAKHQYVNPQFVLDLPNLYKVLYGIDYKKTKQGIKITKVRDGSHAQDAGLLAGDLITFINNKNVIGLPIEFADDLFNKNNQINLRITRGNEEKQISIKKTKFPRISLYKKSTRKFLGYNSEMVS